MRNLFIVFCGLFFLGLSMQCLAQGPGNSCDASGGWYGGSDFQYLTVITPVEHGLFQIKSQPGFDNRQFGYTTWTDWTGEVRKTGAHSYDVTGISYWVWDPAMAPPGMDLSQPELDILHGTMEMLDCNTFKYTIDMWAAYFAFTTERTPFVTPPDQNWLEVIGVTTIVETYHRIGGTEAKHETHGWKSGHGFRPGYAPLKKR